MDKEAHYGENSSQDAATEDAADANSSISEDEQPNEEDQDIEALTTANEPNEDQHYDEPNVSETPTTHKKAKMDARFSKMLDKIESLCNPPKRSRHETFGKYLSDRLKLLPLSVTRSLELEMLSRVHTVIDEYEEMQVVD